MTGDGERRVPLEDESGRRIELEIPAELSVNRLALSRAAQALHALLDDDAVLRGCDAVRKMRQMRVGGRKEHAAAFRRALLGETDEESAT